MPTSALRFGRNFLAAGLIVVGMLAQEPATNPRDETAATFGTTVVQPGGLRGLIYATDSSGILPYFPELHPIGVIYTSSLNVSTRYYREGFPGVTGRYEWFAIDYSGRFWIEKPGVYRFELTSSDGSKLYIDDGLIVDNDGVHLPEARTAPLALAGGIHTIRVSYFKGPKHLVALRLRIAPPSEEWRVFSTDEFKPPPDPASWKYLGRIFGVSSVTGVPGEQVTLDISLNSALARAPAALNWEVNFPVQLLELEGDGPRIGDAATVSGKSLKCTERKPYSWVCSISGGQNPIANGTIAKLRFRISAAAEAGTGAVRIERAEAVTVDSERITLSDAEGTVAIRKR